MGCESVKERDETRTDDCDEGDGDGDDEGWVERMKDEEEQGIGGCEQLGQARNYTTCTSSNQGAKGGSSTTAVVECLDIQGWNSKLRVG